MLRLLEPEEFVQGVVQLTQVRWGSGQKNLVSRWQGWELLPWASGLKWGKPLGCRSHDKAGTLEP